MESVWSVSKLSTESVGSRRQLLANCVHTADADATKQFRRVGVGGVYWAYERIKLWIYACRLSVRRTNFHVRSNRVDSGNRPMYVDAYFLFHRLFWLLYDFLFSSESWIGLA